MLRSSAVSALLALVAASCLGVSSLGTPAAASAAAAAGGSGAPIVVGGDGDSLSPGVTQGFVAGIYRFNKAGGLDGRKIRFTGFLDDGYSAQTNLVNAQQLVENRHVLAVVPFVSNVATGATGTFLAQNKTPFIGWATNTAYVTQPAWGLPIDGSQGNPEVQGDGSTAEYDAMAGTTRFGQVKMAFIAENIAPAISALDAVAGAVKLGGARVVYRGAPIPVLGTTSYAPFAQDLLAAHPNVVFELLDNPDAVGLAAALKAAGYRGAIVNGVSYLPGQLASQPNEAAALNGVYVVDEFPADQNDTPAVRQAEKDLVSVGQPPYLTSGVSQGYWSAIVFEQMLRATLRAVGGDPAKVTGATLDETVNHGFVYTDPIAGGIGTEHFPAAEHITTGCSTLLKTVGTRYEQIAPYRCGGAIDVRTGQRVSEITGRPVS